MIDKNQQPDILVSAETKRRLVRYALAVQRYERENRKVTFRDGSFSFIGLSDQAIIEHGAAKDDLANCPEPEIKTLVHQIQIERIDEAMSDESKTQLDVIQASHDAMLAVNELVWLGHEFHQEQQPKIKPRRRKDNVRRSRRTTRR